MDRKYSESSIFPIDDSIELKEKSIKNKYINEQNQSENQIKKQTKSANLKRSASHRNENLSPRLSQ